jgi:hypothetical protein
MKYFYIGMALFVTVMYALVFMGIYEPSGKASSIAAFGALAILAWMIALEKVKT